MLTEAGCEITSPITNDGDSASRPRFQRQRAVAVWCERAFGADQAASIPQRAIRMLEEAVEAYQAACSSEDSAELMAHRLIGYVFARPVGTLAQELGGIGVTVLALAEAANLDADVCEVAEFCRVMSKPLEHFAKRNQEKNAAGFEMTAGRAERA